MAVPRTIRRLSRRQSESRKDQLRKDQLLRDHYRRDHRRRMERRRQRVEGLKGTLVLLAILGFFALIYWLAISDSLPAAY